MNRREFLKCGLGGLFGAFLTWAGVVKAEEPEESLVVGIGRGSPVLALDWRIPELDIQAALAQAWQESIDEEFEEQVQGHGTGEPVGILSAEDIEPPDRGTLFGFPIVEIDELPKRTEAIIEIFDGENWIDVSDSLSVSDLKPFDVTFTGYYD